MFFGADLDLVVGYDRVEPIKMAAGPLAQHFFLHPAPLSPPKPQRLITAVRTLNLICFKKAKSFCTLSN